MTDSNTPFQGDQIAETDPLEPRSPAQLVLGLR